MNKLLLVIALFILPLTLISAPVSANTLKTSKVLNSKTKKEKLKHGVSVRIIKATITDQEGLTPSTYVLKAGVPVKFEIEVTANIDPYGCMSTIMIGGLYEHPFKVRQGEKIVMEFTPKNSGHYYITCVMGEEWGEIKVK